MIYSVSPPESESTEYKADELITFLINIPVGMKLKKNSIYVAGSLTVEKTGGVLVANDKVLYDGNAGIHAFFKNISTTFMNSRLGIESMVENISFYNRFAKMFYEINKDFQNQTLSNTDNMELRCGVDAYTNKILFGVLNDAGNASTGVNTFAFAPLCSANSTASDIDNAKCTSIKIQMTLESLGVPLFTSDGSAKPAGLTWKLEDLKIHFLLEESAQPDMSPLQFIKIFPSKRDVISSQTNLNFNPPGLIQSYSASFLDQTTTSTENQLATDTLKDIKRLEFTVNGSDSYIKFPILSETELILNYVSALNPNPKESNALYSNLTEQGYGVGIHFISPVDMRNSKFSVNIQCGGGRVSNYSMFNYFQCLDTF
jgi:hypothetical protein